MDLPDVSGFETGAVSSNNQLQQSVGQFAELHAMELKDVRQQVTMRPIVAIFFGGLLLYQNIIVFTLVYLALNFRIMEQLQLIFAVLIAGTLTQSYKISQLIVNKLFEPIDYKDKHERFQG